MGSDPNADMTVPLVPVTVVVSAGRVDFVAG